MGREYVIDLTKVKPTAAHRCQRAEVEVDMVCDHCGTILRTIPAGDWLFIQTIGKCSCAYDCCDAAPRNEPHEVHFVYVDTTTDMPIE